MQYFVQALGSRRPYPWLHDMLMDIATEEFSHLEIVGAIPDIRIRVLRHVEWS